MLEQVGALAGLLRGVGVEVGTAVMTAVEDPWTELLTLLAVARLGGTFVEWREGRVTEHLPQVVITDRSLDLSGHEPGTVVLLGVEPVDPLRDVPWEMAIQAGRSDPAGSVTVPADVVAWVADEPVTVAEAATDDSRYGRWVRELTEGRPVVL
ncbi:hypothetical protein [Nocardioides alcanivorans]|uniref:hypothetical protein n=1 Tax=Nocardioides alcanivorans TaxID=2897352 RepID=UPI001F162A53|nr:hypothetical protein [Nocardioides alcanivorans]